MVAFRRTPLPLLAGDFLAIVILGVIGFLFHNRDLNTRLLTTILPTLAAWALVAPWLGVYRPETASRPTHAWRAALAALFSAPLAATLRGLWLNSAILPLFVAVLGLTNALGMGLWRMLWGWFVFRSDTRG